MDEVFMGDSIEVVLTIEERDGSPTDLSAYDELRVNFGCPPDVPGFYVEPDTVTGNVIEATAPPGALDAEGVWQAQFEGRANGVPYQHATPLTFRVLALTPPGVPATAPP